MAILIFQVCLCLFLLRIVDITNALASVQFSAFAESDYFRFCCGFQMFCIIAQIYLFECFESQPPSIHYIIPAKSWCDRVNHSQNGLAVFICKNREWLKSEFIVWHLTQLMAFSLGTPDIIFGNMFLWEILHNAWKFSFILEISIYVLNTKTTF